MDWQSIETVPKGGVYMLFGRLAGEINGPTERPFICIGEYTGRGDYPGFEWSCHNTDAYAVWCQPTHWMPLPDHPANP